MTREICCPNQPLGTYAGRTGQAQRSARAHSQCPSIHATRRHPRNDPDCRLPGTVAPIMVGY